MAKITKATGLIGKFVLLSLFLIAILQLGVYGAQATGFSHIVMSQNNSTIYQNYSLAIPFSVNLAGGSAGTSYVAINNSQVLKSKGIFLGVNKSIGTPNFTDTLFINTNFDSIAVPGTYKIEIAVGGADPLDPQFYNFTLTVLNITKPTTTTVQTTIPGGSNTISSPSAVTAAEERNIAIVFVVAVVVIILLLVINKIRS